MKSSHKPFLIYFALVFQGIAVSHSVKAEEPRMTWELQVKSKDEPLPVGVNALNLIDNDSKLFVKQTFLGHSHPGRIHTMGMWSYPQKKQVLKDVEGGFDTCVSADKRLVAIGCGHSFSIWSLEDGTLVKKVTLKNHFCQSIEFSKSGTELLVAGAQRESYERPSNGFWGLWNIPDGKQLVIHHLKTAGILKAFLSADGKSLATIGEDNSHHVWNLESGQQLASSEVATDDFGVSAIISDPRRKWIASAGLVRDMDYFVVVRDLLTAKVILHRDIPFRILSVCVSPNGKSLAVAGGREFLQIDGTYGGGGEVKILDTATWEEKFRIEPTTDLIECVSFSPDSSLLACGQRDGIVNVWSNSNGKRFYHYQSHESDVGSICFSDDSRRLFSGGYNGTVKCWEFANGNNK